MNKVTIALITVAAIVIIGGGIFALSFGNYVSEDKGTFTAEISTADSIETSLGSQTPDPGNVFVLALVTLTNEKADDGLSNNSLNFRIKVDNVIYNSSLWYTSTIEHENKNVLKDLGIGASDKSCIVFEIPKSADVQNAEIIYDGAWNVSGTTKYVGTV